MEPVPSPRTMPMTWARDLYAKSDTPCAACGRHLKEGGSRYAVHVVGGGTRVLHPADEHLYVPDAGDMGFHEVGPECRKRFREFALPVANNATSEQRRGDEIVPKPAHPLGRSLP